MNVMNRGWIRIKPFQVCMIFGLLSCTCSTSFSQSSPRMKVVTYNIRYANSNDGLDKWENRVDSVAEYLKVQDIAGLQEVTYRQLLELTKRLSDFNWYGVGRDDGKHSGEHAVIFFRKDRFEKLGEGTFWLSAEPGRVGLAGWDAALPRTCGWVKLRDRLTQRLFLVANTHFDHRGSRSRKMSGELIARRLPEFAKALPVVLLGDFNCQPGSEPYVAMLKDSYFSDARDVSTTELKGPRATWNGFRKIEAGREIDHIFVAGDFKVLQYATEDPKTEAGRFSSDHLPIKVILE